jgi:1-deoxy-D-xylulose-5-phosphate synthase
MSETERLLDRIETPADMRKLDRLELVRFSNELRQNIIDEVSNNPGHFGASLGVVELTVALHYVYNTPYDKIVWDVGHQAYGHKIITGRKAQFHTNRKYKGISGFPRIAESEYDAFGVGHSSTSISAALGIAVASQVKKEKRKVVAVIGDGALQAGLAFEGLNNAGNQKADLLVILNDNNISIDASVGAMKEYLLDITTSRTYNRFKDRVWRLLGRSKRVGSKAQLIASQIEGTIKGTVLVNSNMFEALKFKTSKPYPDPSSFIALRSRERDFQRQSRTRLFSMHRDGLTNAPVN